MSKSYPIPLPIFNQKDEENFWSKVEIRYEDECWPWTGFKRIRDYGGFWINGRMFTASRISFFLSFGDPGMYLVLHKCDNPPCCNPNHLFLGLGADNVADCENKGRGNHPRGDAQGLRKHPEAASRGEKHGRAKLSEEQITQIRKLYRKGLGIRLAEQFGVGQSQILRIVKGEHWKHL